jgi:hypothetical protein
MRETARTGKQRVLNRKLMCKSVWQGGAVLKVRSEKATQFEIISYSPVWTPCTGVREGNMDQISIKTPNPNVGFS